MQCYYGLWQETITVWHKYYNRLQSINVLQSFYFCSDYYTLIKRLFMIKLVVNFEDLNLQDEIIQGGKMNNNPLIILFFMLAASIIISFVVRMRKDKLKANIIKAFGRAPKDKNYNLDSIRAYHNYNGAYADINRHIDDITWNDLDMDKIYKSINVCHTSIGEEYLYEVLHQPEFDEEILLKREKFISYLKDNPSVRLQLQINLAKLGKYNFNELSSCIYNTKSKMMKNPWIYKMLSYVPFLCGFMMLINPTIGGIMLLFSVMINGFVYYINKLKLDKELSVIQYFSSMLWSINKICKIKDKGFHAFLFSLKAEFKIFMFLRGRTSRMFQKGASEMAFFADFFKMIFLSDITKYNKIMDTINNESEAFHRLYKAVGELDMAVCILSYRESLELYCAPDFTDDISIEFDDIYHPLIAEPVLNSGNIKNNSLVTGPNASGKSTFIKALAVNGILAQTIYTCNASKFVLRFSLVMTSMAVRDDLSEGDSYFIAEIKSLKRIVDKIETVPCTCYIDEILRGTNTIERIAASASILKYLCEKDCLCMAASHDIELTEIMKDLYDNYHFSETVTDSGVNFDFCLKKGVTKTSNAIRLLDYMGFDKSIVDDANKRAEKFISENSWF